MDRPTDTFWCPSRASLRSATFALGLVTAGAASAVDQATIDQQRSQLKALDAQVQTVKLDALDLKTEMHTLEDGVLFPVGNAVSVFYSVGLPSFVTASVEVRIDGEVVTTHQYEYNDGVALTYGGADRVLRVALAPGVHSIEVEVAGRYSEDDRDAPYLRRSLLHQFGVADIPQSIEFALNWTGARRAPKLDVREWTETGQAFSQPVLVTERGTVRLPEISNLALRHAQYLVETDRLFSAITQIRADRRIGLYGEYAARARLLEARALLGFGLHREAEAVFEELREADIDAEARNEAMLRLAQFQYDRGYYNEAIVTLVGDIREPVDETIEAKRQGLLGRLYMSRGDYQEAIDAFDALGRRTRLEPYDRYNLAVTLMRAGQSDEALDLLEDVGDISLPTEERLALRDRANLSLAYQHMDNQRFDDAKDAFRRISLGGQFANKGLLGYGWSQYYAAQPDELDEVDPGFKMLEGLTQAGRGNANFFERLGIGLTDEQKLKKNYLDKLNRALVPWAELLARDPMHPAVQESYLAVPFVLDNLDAHQQALNYYERGIELLEETRRRLDVAEKQVRNGRMIETLIRRDIDKEAGWNWEVRDLPNAPETYYLYELIASTRFQEALKNYRDMRFTSRRAEAWLQDAATYAKRRLPKAPAPAVRTGPLFQGVAPDLALDENFSTRSPADFDNDPEAAIRLIKRDLALALAETSQALDPARSQARSDTVLALRPRLFDVRKRADALRDQQRALLETMALDDLAAQRTQAERFLVEARFAVARIFDQATPAPEADPAATSDKDDDDAQ